jgi:glucokinase-like ROK family protein
MSTFLTLPRTINATQMRMINRSAVLELIRQSGPIARSEIGRQLGLSLPTVMRIVDDLMQEDIISYTGVTEWSSGRRRQLLAYNKQSSLVVGVDLGGTKLYGTLANVGGEILDEKYKAWAGISAEEKYIALVELLRQLLESSEAARTPVRGIAIGVPGLTYCQSGVVRWAPALDWRDVPLKEKLENIFHLPVFVDNDVNLAVLGEHRFGVGQGTQNLVLIAIGTGMGAGLIIDGALARGGHEASGEAGYLLPGREALGKHYGAFGPMESIISGTGIAERAHRKVADLFPERASQPITAREVFEAARRREAWALEVVEETIEYLTMAIANICDILDPEMVILGGGVSSSADLLINPILQRLEGLVHCIPRIEASNLGYRASVMGAIALTVLATSGYTGKL